MGTLSVNAGGISGYDNTATITNCYAAYSSLDDVAANASFTYNHTDMLPADGVNYYRLQQTDIDGKFTYSAVRSLIISAAAKSFAVLNNPVSNGLLQVAVNTPLTLLLYDNSGRLVWQMQCNIGLWRIDLSYLNAGVYFLKGRGAVEAIVLQQ